MTIDREELRRLCEAATPGPWYVINLEYGLEREDAEFARAARTAVPALLDALEAAEAAEARESGLRELLAVYVHAHKNGNAVPPNIEDEVKTALAETAP